MAHEKSRFTILRQGMNNYDLDMQVKIILGCIILHNFLRENQCNNGIFTEYESNDMIYEENDEQSIQCINVASSSWSSDIGNESLSGRDCS